MSKWEYCVLEYTAVEFSVTPSSIEGNMDHLGYEGWELVSVAASPLNGFVRMFFKREINE